MEQTPSCKYFRLLADEYIEGELTGEEMREFEAHIAECPECRKEFEELRALKEILAKVDVEIPEGLHEKIMTAVNGEIKPKKGRFRVIRRAAVSAACAVICLSLTVIFALMPMWRVSNETAPESFDTHAAAGIDTAEPSEIENENFSSVTSPETLYEEINQEPEAPGNTSPATDGSNSSAADAIPDATESMMIPESTQAAAEMVPTESAADETAVSNVEVTEIPETFEPETEAVSAAEETDRTSVQDAPAASESSSAPGGEEITFALLIVSGLLAVASFIAFLISLSSVRNTPSKKNGEEKNE